MNKLEVQQRITQNGEPLALDKFEWNEETEVFKTKESYLVLDFRLNRNVTFETGSCCVFKTCHFCTFKTGDLCTFDTGSRCRFRTYSSCVFKTGSGCTFDTGRCCMFNTGSGCTFKTDEHCVVVRRDVYEVIELKKGETIKLNDVCIKGFTVIGETEEMTMEEVCKALGKTIKIKK